MTDLFHNIDRRAGKSTLSAGLNQDTPTYALRMKKTPDFIRYGSRSFRRPFSFTCQAFRLFASIHG